MEAMHVRVDADGTVSCAAVPWRTTTGDARRGNHGQS